MNENLRPEPDIRDAIFQGFDGVQVTAILSFVSPGILCGLSRAQEVLEDLGVNCVTNLTDGMAAEAGEAILMLRGTPKQIVMAEERVIGCIAKLSGIATAAAEAARLAGPEIDVISGAMKKLAPEVRHAVRSALAAAGLHSRMSERPFLYLDKNYIRIFGGVAKALDGCRHIPDRVRVVQLRGENESIAKEAKDACEHGAQILMVDTGRLEDVREAWQTVCGLHMEDQVELAFAGDITLEEIPHLVGEHVRKLCVGRAIIDAPMLDMKFDVIDVGAPCGEDLTLNLLEKSELWIEDVRLQDADLNELARAVAEPLGFATEDILVVDVRRGHITLDLLRKTVRAEQIIGKEAEILQSISRCPGVLLGENAHIHSNGVLGLIALDEADTEEVLRNTRTMTRDIQKSYRKRAFIFPTGFEVRENMITDTNSPYLAHALKERGYEVTIGEPLPDDTGEIANGILDAANDGYSLIITTGGVGAEDKDHTVEAVLSLDPSAATPWIVKYQIGTGRHVKHGVRVAAAELGAVRIISLPGPNDEVRMAADTFLDRLDDFDKVQIAHGIAQVLREKVRREWHHGHHHGEEHA